ADHRAQHFLHLAAQEPPPDPGRRRRSRSGRGRASAAGRRECGDPRERADREGRRRAARGRAVPDFGSAARGAGAARYPGTLVSRDRAGHRRADRNRDVAAGAWAQPDHRKNWKESVMTRSVTEDSALLVHAYLDGELDPANALAFESRMASDPALAAECERVEALRRAMRERLPREPLPPGLRARIER